MSDGVTIGEVAKRAGVSVATVSRALRGLPHVSPATRRRVEGIADELGYRAHPYASRLAAGRSGTIGVALPVLNSWYYANVLAGVESVISEDHLDMHLVIVGSKAGMGHFVEELPSLNKRVDGLLIVDIFMPDHLWRRLLEGEFPVATIGVDTGLFDAVVVDNRRAAFEAVTHLLDLGHRRIGYIGGTVGESIELESAERRRLGMVEAMTARGVEPDPGLQVPGGFSVEGGREAMADLLEIGPPTAVFCASDEMAIGAIQATVEAGLEVPGDISVVGFDDQPVAAAVGLTTIHQPVPEQAARAAAMVLARIEDRSAPVVVEQMPNRLCVRGTSGPVI